MNPHKESWQQDVGIVPKRSKPQLARRFLIARDRMVERHSGKSKWERIGRPLFVEQPLALIALMHPYSPPLLRLKGAVKLYDLYFGE